MTQEVSAFGAQRRAGDGNGRKTSKRRALERRWECAKWYRSVSLCRGTNIPKPGASQEPTIWSIAGLMYTLALFSETLLIHNLWEVSAE